MAFVPIWVWSRSSTLTATGHDLSAKNLRTPYTPGKGSGLIPMARLASI
jgi:hypothetical protein